jgi:hypothetical protein
VDASAADAPSPGRIALTVSLPIDAATGDAVHLGSLEVDLRGPSGVMAGSLTLEPQNPVNRINLNLDGIAPGGPYILAVSSAFAGASCRGASPPFSVAAGETVRVYESLVCDSDGGLTPTFGE